MKNDFYNKESYTIEDIENLIINEAEESIHLDFKDSLALDKSDKKKAEISKDVASFANSDGGIIIYGVKESNHKAESISFVNGKIYSKEWLEQIINSSIQRRISNVLIYPIRKDGDITKTVYIIKIPQSLETPHISKDKRFYKRFNFESVMMEEYEIRQLYNRKLKSKLEVDGFRIGVEKYDENEITLYFDFSIFNDGDISENEYKLNVYFLNIGDVQLTWRESQNYEHTQIDKNKLKISSVNKSTIYPNEIVTIVRLNAKVNVEKVEDFLNNLQIELILFYAGGESRFNSKKDFFINFYKNNIKSKYNDSPNSPTHSP